MQLHAKFQSKTHILSSFLEPFFFSGQVPKKCNFEVAATNKLAGRWKLGLFGNWKQLGINRQ